MHDHLIREAEQAVLGAILQDGELIKECTLVTGMFHPRHEDHRYIFAAMRELEKRGDPIDYVTVVTRLKNAKRGVFDTVGGAEYLAELRGAVASTVSFDHYERMVFDAYRVRAANKAVQDSGALTDTDDLMDLLTRLSKIGDHGLDGSDDYDQNAVLLEIADDLSSPSAVAGIPTGYDDLDRLFGGGPLGGQLIIIAARPSVGKTAMALNLARKMSARGAMPHIYTLEMPTKAMLKRILAAESRVAAAKIKTGHLEEQDWANLTIGIATVGDMPFYIQDKNISTVAEIRAKARKAMRAAPNRKHVIIVDYLQLLNGPGNSRTEIVTNVSRELKKLAIDLDVPVIALSQLSRAVEARQDKRPMMSDLRESGSIEQDADIIAFLYRDDYYSPESERKNIIEIIIAKQRDGELGVVELSFIKKFGLIEQFARFGG